MSWTFSRLIIKAQNNLQLDLWLFRILKDEQKVIPKKKAVVWNFQNFWSDLISPKSNIYLSSEYSDLLTFIYMIHFKIQKHLIILVTHTRVIVIRSLYFKTSEFYLFSLARHCAKELIKRQVFNKYIMFWLSKFSCRDIHLLFVGFISKFKCTW